MPWATFNEGKKFCVYKLDSKGEKDGESLECFSSKKEAAAFVSDLYSKEGKGAAKVGARHTATELKMFKAARKMIRDLEKTLIDLGAPEPDEDEPEADGAKSIIESVKCLMGVADPYQYAVNESYHIQSTASILANVAYLITGEIQERSEDPKDLDQLVNVARGLIKFMLDELNGLQPVAPQAVAIQNMTSPEIIEAPAETKTIKIESKLTGGIVKSVGDGWAVKAQAVLFGDKNHTDLSDFRDYFTAETDFWADSWKTRPMIYNHGLIDTQAAQAMELSAKTAEQKDAAREFKAVLENLRLNPRMGEWTKTSIDPLAFWMEGEIDKAKNYAAYLKKMIELGYLKISSDSASHLVMRERQDNGAHKVTRWPIIAASPTPTPAEPRLAPIELAAAAYKSFGVSVPEFDPQALAIGTRVQSADAMRQARARLAIAKARLSLRSNPQ